MQLLDSLYRFLRHAWLGLRSKNSFSWDGEEASLANRRRQPSILEGVFKGRQKRADWTRRGAFLGMGWEILFLHFKAFLNLNALLTPSSIWSLLQSKQFRHSFWQIQIISSFNEKKLWGHFQFKFNSDFLAFFAQVMVTCWMKTLKT